MKKLKFTTLAIIIVATLVALVTAISLVNPIVSYIALATFLIGGVSGWYVKQTYDKYFAPVIAAEAAAKAKITVEVASMPQA